MSLARGSICWHDFDGVRRRICDLDNGPPNFQCPNPAPALLVVDSGDHWYVCSDDCLDHARKNDVTGELIPVALLGQTPSGFKIYKEIAKIQESKED